MATLVSDALGGTFDTTIGGTVYEDLDSNGIRSGGENGIPGWTVYLDLDNSGTLNVDAVGTLEPSAVTNGDGDYRIRYLKHALYRVSEVVQTGWSATSPVSLDVEVIQGQDTKADFFNFGGGEIVGTIWNDLNDNGVRDTDPVSGAFVEPGLRDWTVYLDLNNNKGQDPTEPTTLTDETGHYSFTDLPAGDYEVFEVLPGGWEAAKGFDDKQTATVTALQQTTADFANIGVGVGSLRGTIWHDVNLDGIRNTDPDTGVFTEPGLADWTVFLDLNNDRAVDPGEPTAVTDAGGEYVFISLAEGDYEVTEVLPAGWDVSPGFDVRQTATVTAGGESVAADFANFSTLDGSIRGTIWNDLNRNGIRDRNLSGAFTDPGLAGWLVYLDLNNNDVADADEPSAVTDADGVYHFAGLQIRDYDVREILPAGWEATLGFNDSETVTVYSGTETIAPDFANFNLSTAIPGSVAGTVWNDTNGNGSRDVDPDTGAFTESGLEGWTVFVDSNSNGVLEGGEPVATTAADGTYSFTGIPPGTVSVVAVTTAGWRPTAPRTGVHTIALKNGQEVAGLDFGYEGLKDSTIRGVVFADGNRDGVRAATERGLADIVVYLDLDNDGHLDTGEPQTVTSANLFFTPDVDEAGTYSFSHLARGTYTVRMIVPAVLSATPNTQLEHVVTIAGAEDRAGVDCAAVFRANEIHGVKFDDVNGNQQKDAGEPGVAGATIFLDIDRDDAFDDGEPSTVSLEDGSYSFTDLSPGAYVVRELVAPGYERTYPATVGGTLWPSGVSNPAVGNVSPLSVTASLAKDERLRQTVSLTLPGSGALTNLVDVFLLFDDTGSFVHNSPIVRAAFPDIISQLQSALPGIDLGFGVGRLEEYGSFAYEYATGRPFILNQPIVAASTVGYMTAIQAALDRTTPGYGGDQPETDIEALYQVVTGLGFDGNNNGSVLDSGLAGLASTQLNPGGSGDVPPFASFVPDPAASVMPAAGTIGGVGFRAGALPIILTATDTGFAYQPKGETTITGVGGLVLPISVLTGTSRPTTPFNSGAGLQQTVTALNALGALVIGLGTNPQAYVDPRQGLEALSKLTGAVNRSAATIANGTADPIAPGDPFYFQIASGFASSVANGVVNAIQNAVTNVAVDISIQASDPRVKITNHTGVLSGVSAGHSATFDIEFVGDGVPHRFDLQFVRAGTNVVLGSIPVVLGTPVPGHCYEFEDLEEGEIEFEDDFGSHLVNSGSTNVAPSFTAGPDQTVSEDDAAQTVAGWATAISPGPPSESGQVVEFLVSNDNPGVFSAQPAILPDGTLRYTPAPNAYGIATVSVQLHDDGGTADGGVDTSAAQTFTITVSAVNDAPAAANDNYSTNEDEPLTVAATGVLGNDSDVEHDPLSAAIVSGPAHGTVTLNSDGSFVYTPAANFNGTDSFTYTANDGAFDSAEATVVIAVSATNDAPLAANDSYSTNEDEPLTVAAAGVLGNDSDVEHDPLSAALVSGPAHGTVTLNPDGSFVYTPAANFNGTDSFTYTANDGAFDSAEATVVIAVSATNDAPLAANDSYSTNEDEPLTVAAAGVLGNDSDVEHDPLSAALVSGPAHGTVTLNPDGSFVYTPAANFNGTDGFTYRASDGAHDSADATVAIVVRAVAGDTKFMVVDGISRDAYKYDAAGSLVGVHGLSDRDRRPRGVAANQDGSLFWVVDARSKVFVYNEEGQLEGAWKAKGIARPEGIATDGANLWIVDRGSARMFYFEGAASRRSGEIRATSNFRLYRDNRSAMDVASDGVHLWVVNDTRSADTVFRYSVGGQLEGSWKIDPSSSHPTGLTIDPNDVNHIWIVDAGTDRVYQYDGAAARTAGSQSAAGSFALAAANRNPQGIADPLPRSARMDTASTSDAAFAILGSGSEDGPRHAAARISESAKPSLADAGHHDDDLLASRLVAEVDDSIFVRSSKAVAARTILAHDEAFKELTEDGDDTLSATSIEHLFEPSSLLRLTLKYLGSRL